MEPMFMRDDGVSVLILGIGMAASAIGIVWIRRITRDPEDHPSSWRSQTAANRPPVLLDPGWRPALTDGRGIRGRRLARLTLAAATLLVGVMVVLIVAEPTMMYGPQPIDLPTTQLGIAGMIVGLIAMVRIERRATNPERAATSWRATRQD